MFAISSPKTSLENELFQSQSPIPSPRIGPVRILKSMLEKISATKEKQSLEPRAWGSGPSGSLTHV